MRREKPGHVVTIRKFMEQEIGKENEEDSWQPYVNAWIRDGIKVDARC